MPIYQWLVSNDLLSSRDTWIEILPHSVLVVVLLVVSCPGVHSNLLSTISYLASLGICICICICISQLDFLSLSP